MSLETVLSRVNKHAAERLPIILRGLQEGLKYEEIAQELGCHINTIYGDVKEFRRAGLVDWLIGEWLRLHSQVTVEERYAGATRLLVRLLPLRVETEVKAILDVNAEVTLKAYKQIFERVAQSNSGASQPETEREEIKP